MMRNRNAAWAIVLAAGEGSRLRALTTDREGHAVPKQFCSLDGGRTLLEAALERARSVADRERVVTIVAAEHRELWGRALRGVPARNVIVQPRNRGTAAGVLLPLVRVLALDPEARVALFPSDHHVQDERTLAASLRDALEGARDESGGVTLLGITPDEAVSDYGWILPAPGPGRLRRVQRFVEKPAPPVSARLLAAGGLWNSFLLAAKGRVLLDLYRQRLPGLLAAFRGLGATVAPPEPRVVERLYEEIPAADFSRDLLQGSEGRLRVLEVPACGWTDLGTPKRVAECLRGRSPARRSLPRAATSTLVLARALRELEDAALPAGVRP